MGAEALKLTTADVDVFVSIASAGLKGGTETEDLQISNDPWVDNGGRVEIIPGQGNTLGHAPQGATRDNSYFFTVTRWQETNQDLQAVLTEIAESWRERGWEVEQ